MPKKQEHYCLNCNTPIFLKEDSNYITICGECNWRNELSDTPAIEPITIKTKILENYISQIAYPLLEKKLLNYLPEKLREAVETFLKEPKNIKKEQYQNIYHNIFKKNILNLSERTKKLQARMKFADFFQNSNFI